MSRGEIKNYPPTAAARPCWWLLTLVTVISGGCLWLGLVVLKAAFAQTTAQALAMMVFSASMIILTGLVGLAAVISRLLKPPRPPLCPPPESNEE